MIAYSMRRMEFFVTTPISMSSPMTAGHREAGSGHHQRERARRRARAAEPSRRVSGCRKSWKSRTENGIDAEHADRHGEGRSSEQLRTALKFALFDEGDAPDGRVLERRQSRASRLTSPRMRPLSSIGSANRQPSRNKRSIALALDSVAIPLIDLCDLQIRNQRVLSNGPNRKTIR